MMYLSVFAIGLICSLGYVYRVIKNSIEDRKAEIKAKEEYELALFTYYAF